MSYEPSRQHSLGQCCDCGCQVHNSSCNVHDLAFIPFTPQAEEMFGHYDLQGVQTYAIMLPGESRDTRRELYL